MLNEIKIHNNIDRILSSSGRVSIGVGGQYICNIGVDTSKSNNNSKPPVQLIDMLKSGCKGDKKDVATIKFCECYGNWFYDNLNDEQFNELISGNRKNQNIDLANLTKAKNSAITNSKFLTNLIDHNIKNLSGIKITEEDQIPKDRYTTF